MEWARPAWPTGRPKHLLPTVALVMALVSNGAGFDEYTACMRPAARAPSGRSHFSSSGGGDYLSGRPSPTPPPPCDFRKQSWCAIPGSGYPWHAVRQFVHENQGLMRRMYGEVRQISVLQAELSSNEVTEFDLKSTGRADGSEGFDFDLHALREAAVVKYTAAMPVKSKGVKVRKGGAKRGGESGAGNKMVDSVLKVADSGNKGGDSAALLKVDDARLKESGSKTQNIHSSTDKGGKIPISTAAELEDTIWQSEYSSFELPTTVVSTLSPESSSSIPGESMDGSQVESSSKTSDQDMPNVFETTTMDAPGSTHLNREMSSPTYKESSITPETPYTTTPYPQFNFYAPVVVSPTTPDALPSSPYEKATVVKVEEFHQEKLFQDAVKEEKEGGEELIHGMVDDDGMMMAANTSVYEEGLDMKDEEESEEGTALKGSEEDFINAEGDDEDMAGYPSGTKVPPPAKLRGVNACPVKEEVVAPFWANNTRGEILALLNLYPFEQYVHWEKCTYEHRQMFCREGCRCEQQYRLHRLLAYDPRNECRGIFSDWFKFPSCCVCMCYNIPSELRHTSRSPRNQHEIGSTETSVSEEETTYEDKHFEKNESPSSENSSVAEENIEVRLLGGNFNENEPSASVVKSEVPSTSVSDSSSVGTVPVVTPLHFYYYYNQHQMNPQPSTEKEDNILKLPLQNNAHIVKDSVPVDM